MKDGGAGVSGIAETHRQTSARDFILPDRPTNERKYFLKICVAQLFDLLPMLFADNNKMVLRIRVGIEVLRDKPVFGSPQNRLRVPAEGLRAKRTDLRLRDFFERSVVSRSFGVPRIDETFFIFCVHKS